MRDYVIINGVNSLTIKGLAISKLPPISKPLMRNMKEEIDGRDGDIITELGYSAYDKEMEIGLYGNFDINEVISFFNGEGTIIFSNEDDKHYYFKILEQIDYEKLLKFKTATITFHCQPFKYPNNETIIEADSVTVEGTGTSMSLSNTTLYESMKMDLLGDTFQDGTPTPTSPIGVETVTGGQEIKVCSKNIYNGVSTNKGANSAGVISVQNSHYCGMDNMVAVSPNTTYTVTFFDYELATTTIAEYKKDGTFIVRRSLSLNRTFTTGADTYYVFCWMFNNNIDYTIGTRIQLELGSQSTSFEEFNGNIYEINLGKNLFDYTTSTFSNVNNATIQTENNTITMTTAVTTTSGNLFFQTKIPDEYLQNGETYIISSENVSGMVNSLKLQLRGKNGSYVNGKAQAESVVFDNNYSLFVVCNPYATTGTTSIPSGTVAVVKNVQVERGVMGTSYASFFNPLKLCKIEDYQDYISKGTGKNLLQLTNGTYSNNGITADVNNGIIILNGTATSNSFITIPSNINSIYDTLSGNYTMCSNNKQTVGAIDTSNAYADVRITGENGTNFIWRNILGNKNATQTAIPSNHTNISLQIRTGSGLIYKDFTVTLQLEKGNQANIFEPYGFNGKWYISKNIDKVILTGTENEGWLTWNGQSTGTTRLFGTTAIDSISKIEYLGYSNYFANSSSSIWATDTEAIATSSTGERQLRLRIDRTIADGTTDIKNWLSLHNTIFYYVLATPTVAEITNEALLTQLNALSNAYAYDGTTNIISSGFLPSILSVSATAIPNTTITNIGNIYAKPLLTIYGSGDISLYLNEIQVLQIALGDSGEITIDVSNMEAYNKDTKILMNRLVTGDYSNFLINSGTNKLLITGDVSNFTMSNYTRWL